MRRFVRTYGASPAHLVLVLGSFALTWVAASKVLPRDPKGVGLWFLGAVVAHDLVLLPAYSLLDRPFRALSARRTGRDGRVGLAVPVVNHVRVPMVLSGLLFVVWFPLILGFPSEFTAITRASTDPYLGRWLAITSILVLASALVYAARVVTARRRAAPSR